MKPYVRRNQAAFDALASAYQLRWRTFLGHQETVLRPFEDALRARFERPIRVLDLGCGVGLDAHILFRHGFSLTGLDVSRKMIRFARRNVPRAKFVCGDFLTHRFSSRFHGVVMDASLHLFPKRDVHFVLEKTRQSLLPGGVGIVCTTKSAVSREGYSAKSDYPGSPKRFRKHWTRAELIRTLARHGFVIGKVFTDRFAGKAWLNVVFRRD